MDTFFLWRMAHVIILKIMIKPLFYYLCFIYLLFIQNVSSAASEKM